MTIDLKPEQEHIIEEAIRQGRFPSVEDAVAQAIQSIAPQGKRQPGKPSLVELFAPLRELDLTDLDLTRNPSSGRPINLV